MKAKLIFCIFAFFLLDSFAARIQRDNRKPSKTLHRKSKVSKGLQNSFKRLFASLPGQLQAPAQNPRELSANPSVLPFDPSQIPQPGSASGQEGQPPMTILPPKFVTPSELRQLEKSPAMAANGFPFSKPRRHRQRRSHHRRRLNAFPFINPGPGFIDVGSNGYSPMSYSAMRPMVPQLSPFLPRDSPPPPVRLQLREPKLDAYKKNIMTQSERAMYDFETKKLKEELKKEMVETTNFANAIASSLQTQFKAIEAKVQEAENRQSSVKTQVKNLKERIEENRQTMLEKDKEARIAKEIEQFKFQQSLEQHKKASNKVSNNSSSDHNLTTQ
jgi:hypothetical protein